MWTYEAALADLQESRRFGRKTSLRPLRALLDALGAPDRRYPIVHLVGTNGKGSTAASLAAILATAGLRTGLYTSPYIEHFGERLRLFDAQAPIAQWREQPRLGEVDPEAFCQALDQVDRTIAQLKADPNATVSADWEPVFFERLTATAFLYYAQKGCDLLVLEAGLGGRLDSTNVIDPPLITLITSLGYDHTEHLGPTLDAIMGEKVAVVKAGSRVIAMDPMAQSPWAPYPPEEKAERQAARALLQAKAEACAVPLHLIQPADLGRVQADPSGTHFELALGPDTQARSWTTPLLGPHQAPNAALALLASEQVLCALTPLSLEARRKAQALGLRHTYWPARLECLSTQPLIFLDGAHNAQGAEVLAASLKAILPPDGPPPVFLFGYLEGKSPATLLGPLLASASPQAIALIPCEEPRRRLAPEAMAQQIQATLAPLPCPLWTFEDAPQALAHMRKLWETRPQVPLVAFGSLFLAAPFKRALRSE